VKESVPNIVNLPPGYDYEDRKLPK
jgi:hypothetical protein